MGCEVKGGGKDGSKVLVLSNWKDEAEIGTSVRFFLIRTR